MRRIKLISLLLLGLILTGCATVNPKYYYGISMNSVQDAKDFKIISGHKEEVKYYKNDRTMNPDIYAWAEVSNWTFFIISVTNNTKKPIDTNYFSDDFELTDKDGRTFKLEKYDISFYPKANYINPGETLKFPVTNPFDYEKFKNETAMIVCTLGSLFNRVTIVLKPLPEEQSTPTNKK
jgi:hypothetical protein